MHILLVYLGAKFHGNLFGFDEDIKETSPLGHCNGFVASSFLTQIAPIQHSVGPPLPKTVYIPFWTYCLSNSGTPLAL